MRQASEIALKLASLSVYNSILQQSVPSALYELLWAACTNAKEFVMAWGNFVQVLAKESALDTSAQAMTQAILYHQNPFSLKAAEGTDTIPLGLTEAAKRDLSILTEGCSAYSARYFRFLYISRGIEVFESSSLEHRGMQ